MEWDNAILEAKIIHFLRAESLGIISCYLERGTKSCDDSVFNKVHNNCLSGFFGGYGLYPLVEIVGCREIPAKSIAGIIFEFPDKVKAPLLKGGKDNYWCKGKSSQLLLPCKELTLLATLDMFMHIYKDGWPIASGLEGSYGQLYSLHNGSHKILNGIQSRFV